MLQSASHRLHALFLGLMLVIPGALSAGCAAGDGGDEACGGACSAFQICCAGATGAYACRDRGTDPNNCGMCGNVCTSGVCSGGVCSTGPGSDGGMARTDGGGGGGMCTPTCGSDFRCCGSTCVRRTGTPIGTDGRSDPSFGSCMGCGIGCDETTASSCSVVPGSTSGMPQCLCGNEPACSGGDICARLPDGQFGCSNLMNDPDNCGMVGRACAEGETCSAGECRCGSGGACGGGQACCGGACVDTASSVANCGMCGRSCSAGETCGGGVCLCGTGGSARTCAAPVMGASLGETCCSGSCVPNSDANCGSCGTACTDGNSCVFCSDLLGGGGGGGIGCGIDLLGMGICIGGGGGGGDGGISLGG